MHEVMTDLRKSPEVLLAQVGQQVHIDAGKLMLAFESLGQNCEFGLVQRKCGVEPLDLLRFTSTSIDSLLRALDSRFEGIDAPGNISLQLKDGERREFMAYEGTYGLSYSTFRYAGEIEESALATLETKKVSFLKRKILEDLETGNRIFVWQNNGITPEPQILALYDRLSRYGRNRLLCVVTQDDTHPDGTVQLLKEGLLKGYIGEFAPAANVPLVATAPWLKICIKAYMTLNGMSETQTTGGGPPEAWDWLGETGTQDD
jgi:hypothetical protein